MAQSISYGVPTDRCGLQLRLGIEKGFFREEGIDLSLRVVFGGPEIAAELDSGRLHIGELGTPPGLTAIGRRRAVQGRRQRRASGRRAIFCRAPAVFRVGRTSTGRDWEC